MICCVGGTESEQHPGRKASKMLLEEFEGLLVAGVFAGTHRPWWKQDFAKLQQRSSKSAQA